MCDNVLPAVLRHFFPLRIYPLEIPDQLCVGDLGPAGQDHVLPRPDGLGALRKDQQVRLAGPGAELS